MATPGASANLKVENKVRKEEAAATQEEINPIGEKDAEVDCVDSIVVDHLTSLKGPQLSFHSPLLPMTTHLAPEASGSNTVDGLPQGQ